MLFWFLCAALAAPAPEGTDAIDKKVSLTVAQELTKILPTDTVRVVVELTDARFQHDAIAAAAQIPGVIYEVHSGEFLQLRATAAALRPLASLPFVKRIRRPHHASPKGRFTTEALSMMGIDRWHDLGLRGTGERVAIIDVGFTGYKRLRRKQLPRKRDLSLYLNDYWDVTTHGTSVAEIVHALAPDAHLALYSFLTDVEFLASCDRMIENGETIVNGSIGFDNVWHADGTSPFTRKVDELAAAGITWLAAAGNEADMYWVGTAVDSDGDGWLEFNGSEYLPVETWGGSVAASLRWSEPFGAAGIDLDLYLEADTDANTVSQCGGIDTQDGSGDPYESFSCSTDRGQVSLSVFDHSGRAASEGIQLFIYVSTGYLDESYQTLLQSLTLPGDSAGAISVGAYDLTEGDLAWYSSHGPTDDGRLKPDIVGPSHVTTRSDSPDVFTGTSAATPHIAGAVALLNQASGGASTEALRAMLIALAQDQGAPGPDPAWGHGLVLDLGDPPDGWEAYAVERRACGCSALPSFGGLGAWLTLTLLVLARRRSPAA